MNETEILLNIKPQEPNTRLTLDAAFPTCIILKIGRETVGSDNQTK